MEDPAIKRSDIRIGAVVVIVVLILPVLIWFVVRALGGDTHGIITDKTNGYVTCPQQSRMDRPPRNCTFRECSRIEYRTDAGRTKGVCVSKERYDRLHIGDSFSE